MLYISNTGLFSTLMLYKDVLHLLGLILHYLAWGSESKTLYPAGDEG